MKKNSLTNIIKGAKNKIYRRCLSANGLFTSSVGATTSLILILVISSLIGLFSTVEDIYADSISLSVSDSILSFDLTPISANGTFASSDDITVNVELDGIGGYTVGIRSNNSNNPTDLINTGDSTKTFSSISNLISAADFSANTSAAVDYNGKWGYLPSKYNSLDNISYRPAPNVSGDIIETTSGDDDTGEYTISIGARAGFDVAAGSYSNTFVIIAIANASCNPNAGSILEAVCMQDMNDDVANSMDTNKQYILTDNRDKKEYYVAKMKDGRVWMTQNLDLDLETEPDQVAELTSENTDLNTFGSNNYDGNYGYTCTDIDDEDITLDTDDCKEDGDIITWMPSNATATTASGYGSNKADNPASFDPGEVYYYFDGSNTTTYSSESACTTAHNDNTCPHYHVGNYYNWSAAIASNDSSDYSSSYATADNSICPAGWRLPEGITSSTTGASGYYSEINYTWVSEGLAQNYITGTGTATYGTDGWTNIRLSPMYMVAAGYKNGTSNPTQTTNYGRYWTGTTYNGSYAYGPYFYSSGLYPAYRNSTNTARGRGLSVRCIARQSNTGHTEITFDGNGSDGGAAMSDQTINANTFGTLNANTYTRTGASFYEWNTKNDGSGTSYANEANYYATVGTDTKKVTLYAQWVPSLVITFDKNSNDATGAMATQTIEANSSVPLILNSFARLGYVFKGWNTERDGSGINYENGYPVNVPADNIQATMTLYAQWIVNPCNPSGTSINAIGCMQDINSNNKASILASMAQGVQYQLYDNRDYKQYFVAKQADGNIWMTQNLDLSIGTTTLTSENTNLTTYGSGAYSDGYDTNNGIITWTPAATAVTSFYTISGTTVSPAWPTNNYTAPYSAEGGDVYVYTSGSTSADTVFTSLSDCMTTGGHTESECMYYHVGNYYGWSAAIASNDSSALGGTQYENAANDICPAGWRLPIGTAGSNDTASTREFGQLFYSSGITSSLTATSYATGGFNNIRVSPLYFVRGGNVSGSSLDTRGSGGRYWSSTVSNSANAYIADFVNGRIGSAFSASRYYGRSIRCVSQ